MPQMHQVSEAIDNSDDHTQDASNSGQTQSGTVVTTIQAEPIIAKVTVSNQIQSKTVATTIKKEPTGQQVTSTQTKTSAGMNICGSSTKRKLEVIEISDDEADDVDVRSPSRVKTGNSSGKDSVVEDSAVDDTAANVSTADDSVAIVSTADDIAAGVGAGNISTADDSATNDSARKDPTDDSSGAFQTPEVPLQLVNEGKWADKRIAWAEKFFQRSESRIILGEGAGSSSNTHKLDCFLRVFQRAESLATIRKGLLALESQAYPYSTNCILEGAVASATIDLKDACSHCLVTHTWMLNLDDKPG